MTAAPAPDAGPHTLTVTLKMTADYGGDFKLGRMAATHDVAVRPMTRDV